MGFMRSEDIIYGPSSIKRGFPKAQGQEMFKTPVFVGSLCLLLAGVSLWCAPLL